MPTQTRRNIMNRFIATSLALSLGYGGSAHAQGGEPAHSRHCKSTDDIVEALSTALEVSRKYQDVTVAEAEGYAPVSPCESSPDGTMGIHYAHPDKLAAPPDVA